MLRVITFFLITFNFTNAQHIINEQADCDLKNWYSQFDTNKFERSFEENIEFIESKLIGLNTCKSNENSFLTDSLKAMLYYRLGGYFREINITNKSLKSYQTAIQLFEKNEIKNKILCISYRNTAILKGLNKDFQSASQYFNRGISISKIINDNLNLFLLYKEVITSLKKQSYSHESDTVLNIKEIALQIDLPKEDNWRKINLIEIFDAKQFESKGQFLKAIELYNKAIKKYCSEAQHYKSKKNYNKFRVMSYYLVRVLKLKIGTFLKLNHEVKAIEVLDELEKLQKANSISNKLFHFKAELLQEFVQYYITQQNYPQAQQYHQQILQFINPNFTYQTIYQNPSPNQIIGNPYLLTTLADKAEIFKKMHTQTNNKTNLTHALECYELSYTAADQMRKEYSFEEANRYMSAYTYGYYEKAIELCLQLAKAYPTQKEKYKKKAFEIAQRSSMKTLFWTINSKAATKFLPEEEVKSIEELRKKMNEAKEIVAKPNNRKTQQTNLFEARQNYDQALKKLEEKYPKYAKLKFENQMVSVDTLQQNRLNENEALLNYFVGDSSITCFVVTQTSFQIVEIDEVDSILNNIKLWRESIQKKETSNELASELYQQLLLEVLSYLPENINTQNTLIINADAALASIPFEALKEQANQPDYLLHKYIISYTLHPYFINKREQKSFFDNLKSTFNPFREKKKFKGFTADYSNHHLQLNPLPFAKQEIENIQQLTDGVIYHQATKKLVIEQLKDSEVEIIHFATHAVGDSLETANSKIFLTPYADVNISSQDDLYLDDILNLNCMADLVVLSACQTGLGVYNQGEGISSLARAFRTIGSKSLVMSLWKANDLTTASIMENFYQHLENGELKSEALRQAKIDFLNSDKFENHQKDPYYWAAFLLQGEPDALY